jgi:hypothetical protein
MRHRNTVGTINGAARERKAGPRSRRSGLVALALLLGVVASAVSGCVLVPVGGWGWGYEHEHGRWHDRRGYYRGEHYYYGG